MRPIAKIFPLLRDHAGRDLDAVLADQRARPLMDQIGALGCPGGETLPLLLRTSVREAWLRLGILSREHSKRETPDYDEKESSASGDPSSQRGSALRQPAEA